MDNLGKLNFSNNNNNLCTAAEITKAELTNVTMKLLADKTEIN